MNYEEASLLVPCVACGKLLDTHEHTDSDPHSCPVYGGTSFRLCFGYGSEMWDLSPNEEILVTAHDERALRLASCSVMIGYLCDRCFIQWAPRLRGFMRQSTSEYIESVAIDPAKKGQV